MDKVRSRRAKDNDLLVEKNLKMIHYVLELNVKGEQIQWWLETK